MAEACGKSLGNGEPGGAVLRRPGRGQGGEPAVGARGSEWVGRSQVKNLHFILFLLSLIEIVLASYS